MSFTNIKTKSQGFTIVELLIVVVVIAILAAITIVSYNGITTRANASSAAASAATVQKKAELYSSDGPTAKYPIAFADLSGSAATTTYYLSGISNSGGSAPTAANGKATVQYFVCGTNTSAAATSLATITNVTGGQIKYYDYLAGSGLKSITVGQDSGTSNTYNVTCWAS